MTEIKPDFEIAADDDAVKAPVESVKRELTPEQRLWEMEDSLEDFAEPFVVKEEKVEKIVEEVKPAVPVEEDEDDGIYIEPAETEEEATTVIDLNDDIPVFEPKQEPLRTLEEQVDFEAKSDASEVKATEAVVAETESGKETVAEENLDDMFEDETVENAVEVSEKTEVLDEEAFDSVAVEDTAETVDKVVEFEEETTEEISDVEDKFEETEIPTPVEAPAYFLGGGDTLLAQIDAFREKAMQLASMINEKESKAKELESVVASYEEKNRLLEEELNVKREEADSLKTDVESQVNRMLASLKDDMNKMGVDISDRVSACSMNINTDDITASVSDYFDNVTRAVNSAKDELVEKYHSENVRLYRNVQDLMKELDNSDEIILKSQQQYESLKTRFGIVTGLLILNFFIAVCVLILSLNIF